MWSILFCDLCFQRNFNHYAIVSRVSQSVSRTIILTIIHVLEFMLSLLQTVDVYVEKSTCYSQTSKKNLVRTVLAFSLYLGPRFYFSLNQIFIYLVNKSIVIIKPGGLISL